MHTHIVADIPEHDRPVFVLTQHRSGGTLLCRLLNCHPGLVIWGEHAGILNKLAEARELLEHHRELMPERPGAELQRYVARGVTRAEFQPWTVPFGPDGFAAGCRALVRGLFAAGVGASQRWGFKEIRYHNPRLVCFLTELFPAAQFVVLDRDPVELCVSDMLVSWGLEPLLADGIQHDVEAFEAVVRDCLYAILVVQRNLAAAGTTVAGRSIALRYEALAAAPGTEMDRVFRFLGLPIAAGLAERMRVVSAARAGATDRTPGIAETELGLLTAPQVRATAERLLPKVAARLACQGVDPGRLRRQREEGRYSYLVGDHAVTRTALSTMF